MSEFSLENSEHAQKSPIFDNTELSANNCAGVTLIND